MRGSHPIIVNNEDESSLSWRQYLLVSEAERELESEDNMGLTPAEFYVRPYNFSCSLGKFARKAAILFSLVAASGVVASLPSFYTAKYLLKSEAMSSPWDVFSRHPLYIIKVRCHF